MADNKYDIVIIGAGIGGLTCGCYLSKYGLKTLILEKHRSVGGYCTSFKRKDLKFDTCIHYLGSCRENGQIGRVIRDLDIGSDLKLLRVDPTDIVVSADKAIKFHVDTSSTVSSLKDFFPDESRNIDKFFDLILNSDYVKLYSFLSGFRTFKDLLDSFFKNIELKRILGVFTSNMGLSSFQISAVGAVTLFKEFVLDGGYYLEQGMQGFADTILKKFREFGGEIMTSSLATKIKFNKMGNIEGVIVDDEKFIGSKFVVSNCDANYTFRTLIGSENLDEKFFSCLDELTPTVSAFMAYLGVDEGFGKEWNCGGLWKCPAYDAGNNYFDITLDDSNDGFVFASFLSQNFSIVNKMNSLHLIVGASYKSQEYWEEKKAYFLDVLISRLSSVFPDFNLAAHLRYRETATPHTLFRYTNNYNGAILGWSSVPSSRKKVASLYNKINFPQLFFCGHWAKLSAGQGGVPMVVTSGRRVAKAIYQEWKNV